MNRRSVRQWEELLDLGIGPDGGNRSVPLRRLHLEGIDPRVVSVRQLFQDEYGGTGHFDLAVWPDGAWDTSEPNLDELSEKFLFHEAWRQRLISANPPMSENVLNSYVDRRVGPFAWWVSTGACDDGAVFHSARVSRYPLSQEGLRFLVGIEGFQHPDFG